MVEIKLIDRFCTTHVCTLNNMYCYLSACLIYISRALQRDPGYMKGLAFLDKILTDQKCLQIDKDMLFKDWYVPVFSIRDVNM